MHIITQLEKQKITLYAFHRSNIIETDEGLIYDFQSNNINNNNQQQQQQQQQQHICNIATEDGYVKIYKPIIMNNPNNTTTWISPEIHMLIESNTLPIKFHFKTIYYSIGCMIESLLDIPLDCYIKQTKLGSFITRCKQLNIYDRFLFI